MESPEIMGLILGAGLVMLYFLPLIVANSRGRQGQLMIGLGNFLLGWTVIGWIVLLVVAFTGESKADRQIREQLAGLADS